MFYFLRTQFILLRAKSGEKAELLDFISPYTVYTHVDQEQYKIFCLERTQFILLQARSGTRFSMIVSFNKLSVDGAEMQSFWCDNEIYTIKVDFSYNM